MDSSQAKNCRGCAGLFIPANWNTKKSDYICKPCRRIKERIRISTDVNFKNKRRFYNATPIVKERSKLYWRKYNSIPENKIKQKARRLIAYALEVGKIKRHPCQQCGALKTDAHHEDYSKPLEVIWLCRRCHCLWERSAMLKEGEK